MGASRLGASRLAEPGSLASLIPGERGLELVHLAPAVTRERVGPLVAQEGVFPTKSLATQTIRLIILMLGPMVAPKVVLASEAEATQVTLNVHWGVNKNTLHVGQLY